MLVTCNVYLVIRVSGGRWLCHPGHGLLPPVGWGQGPGVVPLPAQAPVALPRCRGRVLRADRPALAAISRVAAAGHQPSLWARARGLPGPEVAWARACVAEAWVWPGARVAVLAAAPDVGLAVGAAHGPGVAQPGVPPPPLAPVQAHPPLAVLRVPAPRPRPVVAAVLVVAVGPRHVLFVQRGPDHLWVDGLHRGGVDSVDRVQGVALVPAHGGAGASPLVKHLPDPPSPSSPCSSVHRGSHPNSAINAER